MTDPNVAAVAGKLTEAQRTMLADAKVWKPIAWLKGYILIEIDCRGRQTSDADALEQAALVNLPVRTGDRTSTLSYLGELLPLGLAIRDHLKERSDDA